MRKSVLPGFLASSGVSYEAETIAILSWMTGSPSDAVKILLNNLIIAYKTCGYWNLSDVIVKFNIFDAQAGLLNLKSNSVNPTAVNSPVFTKYYGYEGDALTKYINTNFTPSINGVQHTLNNAHAYIDCYVSDTGTNKADGALSTPNNFRTNWSPNAAFSINSRINSTLQSDLKPVITGSNFFGRLDSNNVEGWHEGVKTSNTCASTGLPTIPIHLFKTNYAIPYYHSSKYRGYSFGAYLNDTIKGAVKSANDTYNAGIIGLIP